MRFERDEQTGVTILVNAIAQGVFILVAAGLCMKVLQETPPRYPMVVVLVLCAVYLLIRMVRMLRLRYLWKNAYFEMGDDRAKGFAANAKLRQGKPFDIPAADVKKAELTTVPMTRKTALNALKLTTDSETYVIVGLVADEQTRRVFHKNDPHPRKEGGLTFLLLVYVRRSKTCELRRGAFKRAGSAISFCLLFLSGPGIIIIYRTLFLFPFA